MTNPLGRWAVIDIETSGIDPSYDGIIDLGFLQFEGTKLVRKYSSLVRWDGELSYFIQKLTGITSKMANKAPVWNEVEPELLDLYGHSLLAHNSDFEKSFLEGYFEDIDDGFDRERFEDSLYFLALLFPNYSSLKLEKFICDLGIADHEEHRGFQDSLDLLKVLLVAVGVTREKKKWNATLKLMFEKYGMQDYWFYHFFLLPDDQLETIANEIDFNLSDAVLKALELSCSSSCIADDECGEITSPSIEFNRENVQNILRDADNIEKVIPGYSHRKVQEELALRVGQSFKNEVHSIIQAPTGTGKTFGYLLPSVLFSVNDQKQILIATGTKTLQNQAMNKEVPQVEKLFGLPDDKLKIRRLMGSKNHLCEFLFRQDSEDDLLLRTYGFERRFSDMFLELVFDHNSNSLVNDRITRDDIPFVLKKKFDYLSTKEAAIAVDFRACSGPKCPYESDCSYRKGIRDARDADIIVGNHALMFSWPNGFPRPEHIIVDEAHKIEGEAQNAFSVEITQTEMDVFAGNLIQMQGIGSLFYLLANTETYRENATDLISTIRENATVAGNTIREHLVEFSELMERYFKKMPRFTDKFWNELPLEAKILKTDSLGTAIYNRIDSLKFLLGSLVDLITPYASVWEMKSLSDENKIIALTRFEMFFDQLTDMHDGLEGMIAEKAGYSHSLKYHDSMGFSLLSAPIDVGRILHDGLLSVSKSVVFTSATLGNADGNRGTKGVEWMTGYLYLETKKRFKTGFFLPPIFDYENKTKVFLCDDTPSIYDSGFVEKNMEYVLKLIRKLNGRSLLLFSAKKRFEVAREVLLHSLEGEIPLFIQGMGSHVIEDFKRSGNGVLLGMESFGEGIDIPGEALQFLFIDKIPDIRMDLVIGKRRDFFQSNIGNEFVDYYLSSRTRSLVQKLGRLLRTENDIGGAIIVDSRIKRWKSDTMNKFYNLMRPYKIERAGLEDACDQVADFLEKF